MSSLPHKTIEVFPSKASRELHLKKEQDTASLIYRGEGCVGRAAYGFNWRKHCVSNFCRGHGEIVDLFQINFIKWLCASSLSPKEEHLRSNWSDEFSWTDRTGNRKPTNDWKSSLMKAWAGKFECISRSLFERGPQQWSAQEDNDVKLVVALFPRDFL